MPGNEKEKNKEGCSVFGNSIIKYSDSNNNLESPLNLPINKDDIVKDPSDYLNEDIGSSTSKITIPSSPQEKEEAKYFFDDLKNELNVESLKELPKNSGSVNSNPTNLGSVELPANQAEPTVNSIDINKSQVKVSIVSYIANCDVNNMTRTLNKSKSSDDLYKLLQNYRISKAKERDNQELVEVNLKEIYNSFVIKNDSLTPPWDIVDHYYQKIQVCRHSIGSQFTRHNYLIKEKTKDIVILECKYCRERIEINDLSFMSKIKKRELWEHDQNKRPGDITIYRFFWRKDKNNKWLSFPEMSYCGQTYDTAEQRCITNKNSHINAAMGITDNNMLLQHNIRNYKLELAQVVKRFKVEVLKIIPFQGNWKTLELINDFNLRENLIQTAHYRTEELADNFEKSMIAFFHSQFPEFGKNFEQGGRKPRNISLFNLKMVDDALQKVAFVSRRGGEAKRSFQKFLGLDSNQRKIADNNVLYYFGRSFEEEINRRKYIFVDKLLRQGYKIKQIAQKFNDMTKDYSSIGINEQTVSKWISNKIYSDRFPRGYPAPEIRRLILEEEFAKYIRQGLTDFYDLLEKFLAFNRKTIEEAVDELEKEGYNRDNITNRMIDLKRRHLLSNFFRPYGGFKKFIEKYSN